MQHPAADAAGVASACRTCYAEDLAPRQHLVLAVPQLVLRQLLQRCAACATPEAAAASLQCTHQETVISMGARSCHVQLAYGTFCGDLLRGVTSPALSRAWGGLAGNLLGLLQASRPLLVVCVSRSALCIAETTEPPSWRDAGPCQHLAWYSRSQQRDRMCLCRVKCATECVHKSFATVGATLGTS
jgi:hypothetical protein